MKMMPLISNNEEQYIGLFGENAAHDVFVVTRSSKDNSLMIVYQNGAFDDFYTCLDPDEEEMQWSDTDYYIIRLVKCESFNQYNQGFYDEVIYERPVRMKKKDIEEILGYKIEIID